MEWKFGVSGCKLSNGEWINSKALLYSTGNYSHHPAINQNGKEHEKDCVCVCVYIYILLFSHSVVSSSALAHQASLLFAVSCSLLKLMSIESAMPSNQHILCHPLLLLPSIFPSIRVVSNESILCIRWPKYWSFSFGISPSNEYSGLISFRIDWFDLLAVQGTLKSLEYHDSKASVLQHSAFFMVQFSHPYMTTE